MHNGYLKDLLTLFCWFYMFMQLPSFLDMFGWCTWDAFYTDVTAEGVEEGLKR